MIHIKEDDTHKQQRKTEIYDPEIHKEVERMIAPTNKPTLVQWANLSFVIMDAPTNDNLQFYLKELKKYNVTDLVRACEITYDREAVNAAGINVHELEFPDGEPPDDDIFQRWLSLVADRFKENQPKPTLSNRSIAVHCVAGLGRYDRHFLLLVLSNPY